MINHIHHDIPAIKRATGPDGSRVYETPSGRAYPSVTSVTGLHGKKAIMEWRKRVGEEEANRISSRATRRGTRIHSLCESFLRNEEVVPDMFDQDMWNSFSPLLHGVDNVHALETPLYSDHLQVAGTVDCIAEYKGKLSVVDFKTSSRIKSKKDIHSYFMQCAAYSVAFEERTGISVPRLVILMAVDNEEPLVFVEKRDAWIGKFIEMREEFRQWKKY
jgi:genome maintenance exonuclease 1